MATYSKLILSGSVNGKQIALTGSNNSSSVTPIHTAIAGTTSVDEIYLYAACNAANSVTCSILWGSSSVADSISAVINPAQGRVLLVDGKLLQNELVVSGYGSGTGVVIDGFVNRVE
jgi:hypothetical protein